MNTYAVSYRRDAESPTCTNVVHAMSKSDVERYYAESCEWFAVAEKSPDELREMRCPTIDLRNYFDRNDYYVEVVDDHTGKDGTRYSLVCYECGYLSIVTNAEFSDDYMRLYYDEEVVGSAPNRYTLERWRNVVNAA